MRRIDAVDTHATTLTAEAGATLASVQSAAEDANLYYPIDLGARGSCTIGGNTLSNKVGGSPEVEVWERGLKVRYEGLDVVTPTARLVQGRPSKHFNGLREGYRGNPRIKLRFLSSN